MRSERVLVLWLSDSTWILVLAGPLFSIPSSSFSCRRSCSMSRELSSYSFFFTLKNTDYILQFQSNHHLFIINEQWQWMMKINSVPGCWWHFWAPAPSRLLCWWCRSSRPSETSNVKSSSCTRHSPSSSPRWTLSSPTWPPSWPWWCRGSSCCWRWSACGSRGWARGWGSCCQPRTRTRSRGWTPSPENWYLIRS